MITSKPFELEQALTYHPYRFLTDTDADELIGLFRKMRDNGKHVSIMGHFLIIKN